jgi:hypothetical protein
LVQLQPPHGRRSSVVERLLQTIVSSF